MKNEIVIFETENTKLEVPFTPETETVWLNRNQMAELFDTARSSIAYNIGDIFAEDELDNEMVVAKFAATTKHTL